MPSTFYVHSPIPRYFHNTGLPLASPPIFSQLKVCCCRLAWAAGAIFSDRACRFLLVDSNPSVDSKSEALVAVIGP
jgi:hypothetical protein